MPIDYEVWYGRYGVRQSDHSKVVIPVAVDIYTHDGSRKIGFAQSVRPRETRATTLVRHLSSQTKGMPIDQIPQPPEFGVTITRLAIYDYANSLLNIMAEEVAPTPESFLVVISEQRIPFMVTRKRVHPATGDGYETVWGHCMITSIDEGEDNIGTPGTPITETVECTALWKAAFTIKGFARQDTMGVLSAGALF